MFGTSLLGAEEKGMREQIEELMARIAKLKALMVERAYDEDFVDHAQHQVAAYQTRIEILQSCEIAEHLLG